MGSDFINSNFKLNPFVVYLGNWEDQTAILNGYNGLTYRNSLGMKEAGPLRSDFMLKTYFFLL